MKIKVSLTSFILQSRIGSFTASNSMSGYAEIVKHFTAVWAFVVFAIVVSHTKSLIIQGRSD